MSKIYSVWIQIEEMGAPKPHTENDWNRVEPAAFQTLEEALMFKTEMEQRYSSLATGEIELLDQMSSPEPFTTGD